MAFDSKIFWEETKEANKAVRKAAQKLQETAGVLLQQHTQGVTFDLLAAVRTKTKRRNGEIYAISLGMLRYGIFLQKGSGRGWSSGQKLPTNQSGGPPRKPQPWISDSFDQVAAPLADELARIKGNDMVKEVDSNFRKNLRSYRITP